MANDDARLGVYGFDYLVANGEITVVIVPVRLDVPANTRISPDAFTLRTAERGEFTGVSAGSDRPAERLVRELAGLLEPEWVVSSHVTGERGNNCLVLFAVDGDVDPVSLTYGDLEVDLSPSPSSSTEPYRGLPREVREPISTLLDVDLRDGPPSDETVWAIEDSDMRPLVDSESARDGHDDSGAEPADNVSVEPDVTNEPDGGTPASMADMLAEIEDDIETAADSGREPALSLSGQGTQFSETTTAPGGAAFFRMDFLDHARYRVEAVSDTAEDTVVKTAASETPIEHRVVEELAAGTYVLNVEADDAARWRIDVHFSAPDPVALPLDRSGRGCDVIGPLAHAGFVRVDATNYYTGELRITQPTATGNSSPTGPGLSVAASDGGSGVSSERILSTVDGHDKRPWVAVRGDGEWELRITPHS